MDSKSVTRIPPRGMPAPPPREQPPRELHPAAMQAAADYSKAIDEAARLRVDLDQHKVELLAERQIRHSVETKLELVERERDQLQRFAIEYTSHINTIKHALKQAEDKALEFAACQPPRQVLHKMEQDMGHAIAEAASVVDEPRREREGDMP
jgi:type III secretory pathway component EscV